MRRHLSVLLVLLMSIMSCNNSSVSQDEQINELIRNAVFSEVSTNANIIRISAVDSLFSDVSQDYMFQSYSNERQEVYDEIQQLKETSLYSFDREQILSEKWDELTDKMEYCRAKFQSAFIGFHCFVECSASILGNSVYEIKFDSLLSHVSSVGPAVYFSEDKKFVNYRYFKGNNDLYGTINVFFNDTITFPCILKYKYLDSIFSTYYGNEAIACIGSKWHIINEDGVADDFEFDSVLKHTYESYSYKDIVLITNNGKYGVIQPKEGKVVIPCEYDRCEISQNRIITVKDGKVKSYYPDGTEINGN